MNLLKYIGMDVHKATIVIAVLNSLGKVLMEAIIETKATAILDFLKGQRGTIHIALEEGTHAAWLYDLIRPHVANVVVCDPRRITCEGNKGDKVDAKRLAELLRTNALVAVYHGGRGTRAVKELAESYDSIVRDGTRIKNRLKAIFRGRGIDCSGTGVYSREEREQWLARLDHAALRARVARLGQELDCIEGLSEEAGKDLWVEAPTHSAMKILQSIPGIGPIRAAMILGIADTPHRFRTNRQFWAYSGLGVVMHTSAEYEVADGCIRRSQKRPLVRGLNRNYNRALKQVFKGAAKTAASGEWKVLFDAIVSQGRPESLARLILARKIASITLTLWKKGERYDPNKVKNLHAA
jgi:transposase